MRGMCAAICIQNVLYWELLGELLGIFGRAKRMKRIKKNQTEELFHKKSEVQRITFKKLKEKIWRIKKNQKSKEDF